MVSPNYLEDDPVDLYPASTGNIDEEDPATAEILAEQRRRQLQPMPANGVAGVMAPKAGVPAPQASQDPSALVGAIQRVSDIRAARPELPKPKWWQQAIAGGVGALAGASNARGHAGKIDPTEAIQNIKYPGYAQRLQNWQQQLGGAQAQQEAEQAKLEIPAKVAKTQADTQEQKARAEAYEANAQQVKEQGKMKPILRKDGSIYDPKTGTIIAAPESPISAKAAEYQKLGFDAKEAALLAIGGANAAAQLLKPAAAPKAKSVDQQIMDSATRSVAQKYKLKLDESQPLLEQLPVEAQREATGLHAQYKTDPAMRELSLAMKQMQLSQMPTAEQANTVAQDLVAHRLAPDQLGSLIGGFGAQGQMFKRMVYGAAKKIDPEFDFEKASAEYGLTKSPAFQNTVRYMDAATASIPRIQSAANQLANGKIRSINALINAGKNQINNVDLKRFQTDVTFVGDEIAKILQGGGTGSGTSDAKLKQAQDIFKTSDDPAVVATALQEVQFLLGNRRKTLTRGTYMENALPAPEGEVKTVSRSLVQEYAKDHKMDEAAASKIWADKGYQIQ